jgi:SET domain-containing protein
VVHQRTRPSHLVETTLRLLRELGSMRAISAAMSMAASLFGPPLVASPGRNVEIREIPGKGFGVIATEKLPAGAYLTRYTGRLMSYEDASESFKVGDTSGQYFAALKGADGTEPMILDAEDEHVSGWARYINHSKRRQNCQNVELRAPLSPFEGLDLGRVPLGLYIRTTREICSGEELLTNYGDNYWDDRGYSRLDPRRIAIDYL